MGHANISVFVPHIGCPHQCSFCNQRSISGAKSQPTAQDVRALIALIQKRVFETSGFHLQPEVRIW